VVKSDLAIFGGRKAIETTLALYNPIGQEELNAASKVIESGVLSKFLGSWHEDFYGGPKVRAFENQLAIYFGVRHAITVNSWTSGLIAAIGAIGIEPGDEVIVTPWTMSASATAILHWNAIPVFADIDQMTFNLSVGSIKANITENTRAIVVADIFGQSADMVEIMALAAEYELRVISDSAQAIGTHYMGKKTGTFADIGGYSLNYHKHIHTGEGGVLVTNDDVLAEKLRLIRNHGEVVAGERGDTDLVNLVGYNFRLGEVEAAIGLEQLAKLDDLLSEKQKRVAKLSSKLDDLPGLTPPVVADNRDHSFYIFGMQIDPTITGVSCDLICEALNAEGLPVNAKYQNIHLLPMYQNKVAYGSKGFPWTSEVCKRDVRYNKGICPNAEKLNDETYMGLNTCALELIDGDIDLIVDAFQKVWEGLEHMSVNAITR
jgi:perosamine synthetase